MKFFEITVIKIFEPSVGKKQIKASTIMRLHSNFLDYDPEHWLCFKILKEKKYFYFQSFLILLLCYIKLIRSKAIFCGAICTIRRKERKKLLKFFLALAIFLSIIRTLAVRVKFFLKIFFCQRGRSYAINFFILLSLSLLYIILFSVHLEPTFPEDSLLLNYPKDSQTKVS